MHQMAAVCRPGALTRRWVCPLYGLEQQFGRSFYVRATLAGGMNLMVSALQFTAVVDVWGTHAKDCSAVGDVGSVAHDYSRATGDRVTEAQQVTIRAIAVEFVQFGV